MPPRKRAASAPKAESEQEPLAPETEDDDQQDESPEQAPAGADATEPERSDLPCQECMPNGWPEGAYAVGCAHGTYVREQD